MDAAGRGRRGPLGLTCFPSKRSAPNRISKPISRSGTALKGMFALSGCC